MKQLLTILILSLSTSFFAQIDNFRFQKYLAESPNQSTAFAVPYTGIQILNSLREQQIPIKSITKDWVFIQTTAEMISELYKKGVIDNFYFEFQNGQMLSDTARIQQHVQEVHEGYGDLLRGYTGENVLIGFVDTGIDWTHPDFVDENGTPRVIAYWKQGAPTNATAPQPYNYGQMCDSMEIVNGTCTLMETSVGHGTSVAGAATGNGRANGKEIGMATKSKIIAVHTDFTLQNWTLTVADACDFVFKRADELGIPAVMNLSVGSYFGSHDGNDPASQLMEQLVDAKKGRIIVGAMGNSGAGGDYHLKGKIYQDTNFVWFKNNPSNQIMANSIYFNWWSDTLTSNQLKLAFATNHPTTFEQTPYTDFMTIGTMPTSKVDTIRKTNGEVLGIVEIYKTLVGDSYEIEVLIRDYPTALNDYFQLTVTGVGEFDLWSGAWTDLNDMVTDLPSEAEFPAIANYLMPDSLSTIVSSWACSEKMVTVGNVRNRLSYINNNGDPHPFSPESRVGYISENSSRGPTRKGVIKPEIVSSGDLILGAAPAFMRGNAIYNDLLEIGGWHMRNGGTSMASPVVAGIAALYLEKCPTTSYRDFIRDLKRNADRADFYGEMPNYSYGYGRVNGYKTVAHNGEFTNDYGYCGTHFFLGVDSLDSLRNFLWSTGEMTSEILIDQAGTYTVSFEYGKNCYSTITREIEMGLPPVQPIITANGNVLTSTPADFYQWFRNGDELYGETQQSLVIATGGNYQVRVSDSANCSNYSDYYRSSLGIDELLAAISIFPNPTHDLLRVETGDIQIESYRILDVEGRILRESSHFEKTIYLTNLSSGTYILQLQGESFSKSFKILKL